jgi:aminopeptidase N
MPVISGASDVVPPFDTTPLITWGPLPPGTPHAERARTYAITHQIIHVRLDWPRHAVVGSTTIQVTAAPEAPPTRIVALDAVGMRIIAVTGRGVSHSYDGTTLSVKLPATLRAGVEQSFTVEYETVKPAKGVYFIDRRHVMWTQGETEATRYWVPTYDYPNSKETWEVYARTARGERALSNGRLIGSQDVDGLTEWHWSQDEPASTYLMTLTTGNYTVLTDHWRSTPVDYWTYPDSVQAAWRGFGITPRAVALFSDKIGVDYPWAKYDQVVAPDYIFGGMENVTATTQNDDEILHPAWAEPQANTDVLVAHELGHHWFGDYLTNRSWAHAWLNEGFATFLEQFYVEAAHGPDAAAIERLDALHDIIVSDRTGRRPLVYDRWVEDPMELFLTGPIYPKGALVLQMLRHQFGDSLFWAAMHKYTVDHAFGVVGSIDAERAFEQTTQHDLSTFFKQWVFGAGMPAFRVSYAYDSVSHALTLTAVQVQPIDSLTGTFDAQVDVRVMTDAGPVRGVMPVRGDTSTLSLTLPAPPRAIRWDDGRWLLGVYDFPRPTSMLVYQLARDSDVLGRLEAIELLESRGGEGPAGAALAQAARRDGFWRVRAAAVGALPMWGRAHVDVVLAATRDPDSRVRQISAVSLGAIAGVTPAGEDRRVIVDRMQALAGDSSLYVRGTTLRMLATVDTAAAMPLIRAAIGRSSWTDIERTQALLALGNIDTPEALTLAEGCLAPGTPRSARRGALIVLVTLATRHGAGGEQVAAMIAPLLNDPDLEIRLDAANALGRLGLAASASALQARRSVEAEGRVLQAIDNALTALRQSSGVR